MTKVFKGPDPKVKPRGPKKEGRVKDPKVTSRTVAKRRACFCGGTLPGCDGKAATGHHVLSKAQGGDDVEANIVPASGSGTTGCHGLIEAENVTARRVLGEYLVLERYDTIAYVREKLATSPGDDTAGDDWLARRLFIR